MKSLYDIDGLWKRCEEAVGNCNICQQNRIKTSGGSVFVETTAPLEKIGLDIYFYTMEQKVLVIKDYFTRKAWAYILRDKSKEEILSKIKYFIASVGKPTEIIMDAGKEFENKALHEFCQKVNIKRHTISLENHRSNGRVERLNRDLNLYMRKIKLQKQKINWKEEVLLFIDNYNNKWHRAIDMTPNYAFSNPNNGTLIRRNNSQSPYRSEFQKKAREIFQVNDKIFLRTSEIRSKDKSKPLYENEGKIIQCMDNDSYLVRESKTGKIKKFAHKNITKNNP